MISVATADSKKKYQCNSCKGWFRSLAQHFRKSNCDSFSHPAAIVFDQNPLFKESDHSNRLLVAGSTNTGHDSSNMPNMRRSSRIANNDIVSHNEQLVSSGELFGRQHDCFLHDELSTLGCSYKEPFSSLPTSDESISTSSVFTNPFRRVDDDGSPDIESEHGHLNDDAFPPVNANGINLPRYIPVPTTACNVLSREEQSLLKIMSFLDGVGCPRYVFDELMQLIREEMFENGFDPFKKKPPSRASLVKELFKMCPTPSPTSVPVALEHDNSVSIPGVYRQDTHDVVDVVLFDFREQLEDLLSDNRIFGDLDNLDVNDVNKFGKFLRPDGLLDEVNSGSWYSESYKRSILDPNNEFFLPIIMYVDKTGTDVMQRYGLEPLLFTSSIISRNCRNDSRSWRTLGFIPDIAGKSSAGKALSSSRVSSKGRSARNYHKCLAKVLESFVKTQDERGFIYPLRLGDHVKEVRIIIELAFIINDGKSADMLCGRFGGHGGTKRICRSCDVSSSGCAALNHQCNYILKSDIENLSLIALPKTEIDGKDVPSKAESKAARDSLWNLSSHIVHNALHDVRFGGDPRGVYGNTPTDLMHAFQEGVLKYCNNLVMNCLSNAQKANIDALVLAMFCKESTTQRRFFPRANFTRGFTRLSLLTADEQVGFTFTLMLLLTSNRGKSIFEPIFLDQSSGSDLSDLCLSDDDISEDNDSEPDNDDNSDGDKPIPKKKKKEELPKLPCSHDCLRKLLETLLSFHAWYKVGAPYQCRTPDEIEAVAYSVKIMLMKVKLYLPRKDGNSWRLQKFHDLLHLPMDMSRFGSAQNTDAGPGESSLIVYCKHPSKTSQKQEPVFTIQVARRLQETSCIHKAKRLTDPVNLWSRKKKDVGPATQSFKRAHGNDNSIADSDVDSQEECISSEMEGNPTFHLLFGLLGNPFWNWATKKRFGTVAVCCNSTVTNWFVTDQRSRKYDGPVSVWTSYFRNNVRMRAHPDFRSSGKAWHDWVIVNFNSDEDDGTSQGSSDSDISTPTKRSKMQAGSSCLVLDKQHNSLYGEKQVPCKILCFFVDPLTEEKCALVHCCRYSNHKEDSLLSEVWYLDYQKVSVMVAKTGSNTRVRCTRLFPSILKIPVDSFGESVFVVEEYPGTKEVLLPSDDGVLNRCLLVSDRRAHWADIFHQIEP